MSAMHAVVLALLLAQSTSIDAEVDAYHAMTRAVPACAAPVGDDIVVCGQRQADRYRLPLVEPDPEQGVPAERARLLAQSDNCREKRLFLVGCGMAGASASATFGASGIGKPHVRALGR